MQGHGVSRAHLVKNALEHVLLFLAFVLLGSIATESNILAFSDLLILGMSFPNILGLYILSGKVKRALDEYWAKYRKGELEPERNA